jgi:hypothetical protein
MSAGYEMTVTLGPGTADRYREMQHAHIDISRDLEGDPVVFACFDLSGEEVAAAVHAVHAVAGERFRMSDMSADDVLQLRELTALADELGDGVPAQPPSEPGAGGLPAVDPGQLGEPGGGPAADPNAGAMRRIVFRPARLTVFRETVAQFIESRDEAEWMRDEDREPLALLRGMLLPLEQLCAEALRAALSPESRTY